jgi:hypothetical protein
MPTWWWELHIKHHHQMQKACEEHGDHEGAKIYRQAIESEMEWLGKLNELRQSRLAPMPDA